MGKVIVGMTMSLDGYVSDRQGRLSPLYPDFEAFRQSAELQESIRTTGAVVMGRYTFEMSNPDEYADNYEFQVPIFVLTHHPPERAPKQTDRLTFTFVSDGVESAIRQAKAAANDRDVTVVGGASTIQQCLRAGLADELHVDVMPVLLDGGLRFFDNLHTDVKLERYHVSALPSGRTSLKFRVLR